MASAPLCNQKLDRNYMQVSELNGYHLTGSRSWKLNTVDSGINLSSSIMNGIYIDSNVDKEVHTFNNSVYNMSGVGEQSNSVSDVKSESSRVNHNDRISSIYDNPFYKSFGRQPRAHRDVPPNATSVKQSADTDGGLVFREELGEYKPGTGFVHKLLDKFASLSVREEPPNLHYIKRVPSFDESVDEDKPSVTGSAHSETEKSHIGRAKHTSTSNNLKHRAQSVDSLNRTHRKPHLAVTLRHVERKWERSVSPVKAPRDSHIVAPDIKFARDDIILIENPPPSPVKEKNEDNARPSSHKVTFKGDMQEGELPKPNTVLSVRSKFETASQAESENVGKASKPMSPTSLVPSSGQCSSQVNEMKEQNVQILRERKSSYSSALDSSSKPLDFRGDASRSRFSWTSDFKTAGSSEPPLSPTLSQPLIPSLLNDSSAEVKNEDKVTASFLEDNKINENTPSFTLISNNVKPVTSSRSTASVKALPLSRSAMFNHPSKSANSSSSSSSTSVPPSFTPSIKKTSPVMPVAPFKDTGNSNDGDENRHLILDFKKTNAKPQKSRRVKDYVEITTEQPPEKVKDKTKRDNEEEMISQTNLETNKMNKTKLDPVVNMAKQRESEKQASVKSVSHAKGRAPPVPKTRSKIENSLPQIPSVAETVVESSWRDKLKSAPADSKPDTLQEPNEITLSLTLPSTSEDKILEPALAVHAAEPTEPVRGIPSIIANRMKQNPETASEPRPPGELFGVRLGKNRHDDDSIEESIDIPRKRLTPTPIAEKDPPSGLPVEIENQIANVRKRMEASSKNRPTGGVSQIFDSTQLQKKRRENQAARARANVDVPRLDLGSITQDDASSAGNEGGYRVTQQEIKPCNIEFIGACVSLGRSLLDKNRKMKISIRFHDIIDNTFEYPSEASMLDEYMQAHPDEVFVLEQENDFNESSDDYDFSVDEVLDTPRGESNESFKEPLKSNTSLGHSGTLQSYRGRFQEDYVMGSVFQEPAKTAEPVREAEPLDPDSLLLRPADEDDTQVWSTSTTSDLLF